ncbi:MAG: metal-sulfur cluster assembly factor [Planctomycetes bacterium]|nr:metal-sulfur cluster assembly factor [Planctomycetota bacterium]
MVTHEQVFEALKQVLDPELFVNVVDLGLIYKIDIQDKTVLVDMGMTSPACPAGPQLVAQSTKAIESLEEGTKAEIKIVLTPPWTPDRMSEAARDHLGIF